MERLTDLIQEAADNMSDRLLVMPGNSQVLPRVTPRIRVPGKIERRISWENFHALVAEAREICDGKREARRVPEDMVPDVATEAVVRWMASDVGGDKGAFAVTIALKPEAIKCAQ